MTTIPVMRRDHYDADDDGVVDESGASPLSDDNPQALGTANAGTGSSAARADHVHAMPNRARGAYDAIVYIQDGEVIAEDATGTEIDSGVAGTDDITVINSALSSVDEGAVFLSSGEFSHLGTSPISITPGENTVLCGSGKYSTTIKNVRIEVSSPYVALRDFGLSSDIVVTNAIIITNGGDHCKCENLYLHDIRGSGIKIYPNNDTISYTDLIDCDIIDTDSHGVVLDGTGGTSATIDGKTVHTTRAITHTRIIRCRAIRCGYAATRLGDWACGFDLNENVNVTDLLVENCYAGYCWESGFHLEYAPKKDDIILNGNHSEYNGQKPAAVYGAGVMASGGMTLVGNRTNNNKHGIKSSYIGSNGLYIYDHVDKSSTGDSIFIDSGMEEDEYRESGIIDNITSIDSGGRGLVLSRLNRFTVGGVKIINPVGASGSCVLIYGDTTTIRNTSVEMELYVGNDVAVTNGIRFYSSENCKLKAKVVGTINDVIVLSSQSNNIVLDGCDLNVVASSGIYSAPTNTATIKNSRIYGTAHYGIYNAGGTMYAEHKSVEVVASVPFRDVAFIDGNSGTSTGTGSEQTIAHGLVATPSKVAIVPTETGATVSAVWADATNIYCTVTTGKAFNWSAEV